MPHYETTLILRQDLSTTQAENMALKTQQDLEKANATNNNTEKTS